MFSKLSLISQLSSPSPSNPTPHIPTPPQHPPNFMVEAELHHHVAPVVVVATTEDDPDEDDLDSTSQVALVDTSDPPPPPVPPHPDVLDQAHNGWVWREVLRRAVRSIRR